MQVTLGIYIDEGDWSSYDRQKAAIKDALTTYGTNNIAGLTGEFIVSLSKIVLGLTTFVPSWQRGMHSLSLMCSFRNKI